ncbi:uncharacterized protein B0J16DRAFT_347834 [Fusarium flagelliforme]|uniref:Uncharacterized protein n=1 Tax=Fusarium flagelliforme TaxID=2675880 RepID=A0A395MYY0_9HYPO|nr:uncharacterized protein B0J16DRAFT_347834 [Fusarium flagelliforme]KAH7179855.1 hypothetical protein B0J16DRAFT_347834 [Fusarium flagelliforme]RFN52703.1 hypothetical protein FIE12Z_3046 [Fusarium flagelliforme]
MRSSFVVRFGVGLLAGSVRASPCKPHSTTATTVATSATTSSSWAVDVSSSTIVSSAETQVSSTISESEITEATITATNTATTSDVEDMTTTEVSNTSEATTSAVLTTTASEATTTATGTATTTDVEIATTTALTETSEATISTVPTTTTSEVSYPLETFALVYSKTSGPLMSVPGPDEYVNFGTSYEPYKSLGLTIEPGTDRLRTTGGLYLCTYWEEPDAPGAVATCQSEAPWYKYIQCTQAGNGELSCTGEAVQVTRGPFGGLSFAATDDHVTQFLVKQLPSHDDVYKLFLADEPTSGYTSVTLKAVQAKTQE